MTGTQASRAAHTQHICRQQKDSRNEVAAHHGASVTLHADGPYREQAEALRAPGVVPSLGYRHVLCAVMIIVQAQLCTDTIGLQRAAVLPLAVEAGVMQSMSTGGGEGCCVLAPGISGAQARMGQRPATLASRTPNW
jgi:hypothetical protein